MKRGLLVAFVVACKTQVPPMQDAAPAASVPVIESPSATATTSASTTAPAPAASLACAKDGDCIALPTPCCGARPSNVASRAQVQKAIEAEDFERCKNRLCAMRLHEAACDHGTCVVR